MLEKYQRMLVAAAIVFVVGSLIFGCQITKKLERMVVIAERSEQKIDRFIEATAPLGKATVTQGAAMIESVDAEAMTESATESIKEVGTAAKQHLLEYMERKAAESENTETTDKPKEQP